MSDTVDRSDRPGENSPLSEVVRVVRDSAADRSDAAAELRELRRMRLELLADELKPVFAGVPADDTQFDFVLSAGMQPRLWIDATAHVSMARDGRTYRFQRDSRVGRSIIAETAKLSDITAAVTRHIAERIVERQRMLDGPVTPVSASRFAGDDEAGQTVRRPLAMWGEYFSGLMLVLFGVIAGFAILWVVLTDLAP